MAMLTPKPNMLATALKAAPGQKPAANGQAVASSSAPPAGQDKLLSQAGKAAAGKLGS